MELLREPFRRNSQIPPEFKSLGFDRVISYKVGKKREIKVGCYTYNSTPDKDDYNWVGEDYFLVDERGAVIVMDTASRREREGNILNTKVFANEFLNYYFYFLEKFLPDQAIKLAFKTVWEKEQNVEGLGLKKLGSITEATFTFVTMVDDNVYILYVGNTSVVIIKEDGSWDKVTSTEGMVDQPQDGIQQTVVLSSLSNYSTFLPEDQLPSPGELFKSPKLAIRKVSKGSYVFIFTDGASGPPLALIKTDDAVVVCMPV
ncbi:MAG: hypothetical protein ACPLKP_03300 [Microgenomates group bacterium]